MSGRDISTYNEATYYSAHAPTTLKALNTLSSDEYATTDKLRLCLSINRDFLEEQIMHMQTGGIQASHFHRKTSIIIDIRCTFAPIFINGLRLIRIKLFHA